MKKTLSIINHILKHIMFWGETFIALPIIIALLVGSIELFNFLTGRSPLEDAGAIVGWLLNAVGVCVVVSLTGLVQYFLFGYRTHIHTETLPDLKDDIFDSCVTSFLLLLFSVLVFGLIR